MRVVIQRAGHASVTINGTCKASIGKGLMILVGIEESDGKEDIDWLCKKIVNLRIFDDENGVMNKSILEADGEILVISQFTLHASTKKGNRPSYIRAARPEISVPLYEQFCRELSLALGKEIGTGEFGADMKVELMNDGPVTICIDTKTRNNDVRRSTETSGFLDKGIRSALFQRTHQYGDTDRRSGRTCPRHGTQVWRPILQERRKDNLDDEMADVLWVLLCLANQTGVNLTDAFCRNFEKKTRRDQTRHINNPKLKDHGEE